MVVGDTGTEIIVHLTVRLLVMKELRDKSPNVKVAGDETLS